MRHDPTTAALHEMSLQGWFTSSSGDVESPTGWFAWTEIRSNELDEIVEAFSAEFAEIAGLDVSSLVGGWVLYQDSQGFVDAVGYDLSPVPGYSDARIAFDALEREFCSWSEA